ncbi:MAG: hypothetical protein ABR505_10145 [Actinomycetota bacterium]
MDVRLKTPVVAFLTGVLSIGLAWAGAGLRPVGTQVADEPAGNPNETSPQTGPQEIAELAGKAPKGKRLPSGVFLVGANKTSLAPTPKLYQPDGSARKDNSVPAAQWVKEPGECNSPQPPEPDIDPGEPHASLFPDSTLGWPGHNPNCIYLGGYGIGPLRAAEGVDEDFGVWVRSIAISNGATTVVFQIIDAVGYFHVYRPDVCEDCGMLDMRRAISQRVGLPSEEAIAIGATHTHGGPDGYGGWGGLPKWYWHQIRDSVIASAERAVAQLTPARITVGAIDARRFNNERRDYYYSTPDYLAVWLQARRPTGEVIATLVNYAAHPTLLDDQNADCNADGCQKAVLHADWPGALNHHLERINGGTALLFEGGLGNVSPATPPLPEKKAERMTPPQEVDFMGRELAELLTADTGRAGTSLRSNDIKTTSVVIEHPVTNWPELGLAAIGAFDREFTPGSEGAAPPGAYQWSKQGVGPGAARSCVTASAEQVRTPISAFKIGELGVVTGPGELFSNMTEVVKSKARQSVQAMVFGQTNDSLGYIIQSFEFDRTTNVATEYGTQTAEYEEFFALDPCFGDHVLETQLALVAELGL